MATDIAPAEVRPLPIPRVTDTKFAWLFIVAANLIAWSENTRFGQLVTGISTLVFGGCAVWLRLAQFRDEWRARKQCRENCDEGANLKARIAELEAENMRLKEQVGRNA